MDMRGIEPRTSSMQMMRATTVPHALVHPFAEFLHF